MTYGGWLMMAFLWGVIIATGIFCFRRILSNGDDSDMQL